MCEKVPKLRPPTPPDPPKPISLVGGMCSNLPMPKNAITWLYHKLHLRGPPGGHLFAHFSRFLQKSLNRFMKEVEIEYFVSKDSYYFCLI